MDGKTHTVSIAGNTWVTDGKAKVTGKGLFWSWSDRSKINTYFRTSAQTEEVKLVLEGSFNKNFRFTAHFAGKVRDFVVKSQSSSIDLGTWKINKKGYQKLTLRGSPLEVPVAAEDSPGEEEDPDTAAIEAFTGNGEDYRGFQTKTQSGRTCQAWTSQSPHEHTRTNENYPDKGIGQHNACRNPDDEDNIWCYTTDQKIRWEYCVPLGKEGNKLVSVKVTGVGEMNYCPVGSSSSIYWCRRGPSGILWHKYNDNFEAKYYYSELKVPKGQDTSGAYFMANGFNVGYLGMQVNTETERRVLFSIWSPFVTDDPTEIPEDQRVKLLRKGKNTVFNDFGNEGSGGQSFLRFYWQPERTYGFLVKGEPSPGLEDHTDYTAWHKSEEMGWTLIASWRRPTKAQYLSGHYSFSENFYPASGDKTRTCAYSRQWAYDSQGNWHESTQVNAISADNNRYDVEVSVQDGAYVVKQEGFFNTDYYKKAVLTRTADEEPPIIDFDTLP